MRNLIIDCDTGHDDAVAILMALAHPDLLSLRAVTTVCGNNTLDLVTNNTRHVLDVAGAETILAKGATRPLIGEPVISDEFHGVTGMDGPTGLPPARHPVNTRHAVNLIRDIVLSSDEKITIAALGPLTNIALFIRMYPELTGRIELISLMGGALEGGNCTPDAEFNIFVDPEAAEIVFGSGIPVVMSGLDVTNKAMLYAHQYKPLHSGGAVGKFFAELMEFYESSFQKVGITGCAMHDPCAVAYLLKPDLFSGIQTGIHVELHGERRGKTCRKSDASATTLVLTEVQVEAMADLIIQSIQTLIENKTEV